MEKAGEIGKRTSAANPGIVERTVQYALDTIRLFRNLEHDSVGRIIGTQLLRSGTSIGANVHEAQAGQSKADFICKMSIAHKEARESAFWLRLNDEAHLGRVQDVERMRDETTQLIRILSSILITSKQSKN